MLRPYPPVALIGYRHRYRVMGGRFAANLVALMLALGFFLLR